MVARGKASKPSNVRLGIVGLGMGTLHLRHLAQHGRHVEIVALCDQDAERLALRQREHNIAQAYAGYDDMLEHAQLDAVILAVPNVLHHPFTLKALEAGLHVLCEKPMAMNTREAEQMRDAAVKAKRQLLINFNQRFSGEAWALKQAIVDGALGEIYSAKCGWIRRDGIPGIGGWFTNSSMSGGGAMIDIGVHALDLTLWFMGHPRCVEVLASTYAMFGPQQAAKQKARFDVDDLAMGLIKFDNGATLFMEASWASHIRHQDAFYSELLGTRGGALRRWDYSRVDDGRCNYCYLFQTESGAQVDKRLSSSLDHPPSSLQHFIDVVRDGIAPIPTAEDGVRVMAVLDGLKASAGVPLTALRGGKAASKPKRR